MARGKDAARREAERQLAKRRNSAAHRSLRKRAERGKGAHLAAPDGADAPDAAALNSQRLEAAAVVPETADAPESNEPPADAIEERVPTSELRAPAWLAAEGFTAEDATPADDAPEAADETPAWAQDEAAPYTPVFDPAPRPGDPDYVDPDKEEPAGTEADAEGTEPDDAELNGPEPSDAEPEATEPDDAELSGPESSDAQETAVLPAVDEAAVIDEPAAAKTHEVGSPAPDDADVTETAVLAPVVDEEPKDESPSVARASLLGGAAAAGAAASAQAASSGDAETAASESSAPAIEESAPATDAVAEPAPASTTAASAPEASSETATTPPWAAAPAAGAAAEPASASAPSSSGDDGTEAPARRRGRWAIVPLIIVAIGVLYVGAQALLSGTVPRATEALGVSIGGMSTSEATGALDDHVEAAAAEDLVLETTGQSYTTTATAAGLAVDAEATVDEVTGFTLAPQRLWMHIVGGGHLDPVITVDDDALDATVAEAALAIDGPAVDAGVAIAGESIEVVPGRPAIEVDQPASAQLIAAAWPGSQTVELIATVEDPAITDEAAEGFAAALDQELLAGPVTLVGDDVETSVDAATVAEFSSVVAGDSGLELQIDGVGLAAQMVADDPDLATQGENASVTFDDDHEIVIDEGRPGITIDGEALAGVITSAAGSADRTGELPYTSADAEVSPEDLGIPDLREVVASFDTPLTAEPVRTQNLRTAAADVEGTMLMPGDEFNLHEILSPITAEEGYGDAHVIVDGVLTSGLGGGLSQMATTSYNAAYFAGYELLQHRPHSVWFTRYPAGRESTLWGSTINVRFVNNTPYAAAINSYVSGGRLHVDIWSTPHFEVQTSASPKSNVTQPGTKEVRAANCEAKGPGQPGFTITNTRVVTLDGDEVDRNVDTWTYQPDDAIKCVSEDDDS
ncbi:VanW family protein [Demequina sp. NBRC 110056]|uniref:VanW family protein n=1 Tax=Demequina sp. NBRC 110056 TaxID=1570345 RepID=UPI000A017246|nr:VanW family protein [Demequina sp. NBRC 110056]